MSARAMAGSEHTSAIRTCLGMARTSLARCASVKVRARRRASRRSQAGVRVARALIHRRPSLLHAVVGRQLLALRPLVLGLVGPAATRSSAARPRAAAAPVFGDAAADDTRRARRARVRVAGVDLDAVAIPALHLGRLLALRSAVVGDAAADLFLL